MTSHRALIPIFGDQLSHDICSLKAGSHERDCVLMVEATAEACYAPYHKQKLAFVFSAMRHFAAELRSRGWRVLYRELNDPLNSGDLAVEIESAIQSIALTASSSPNPENGNCGMSCSNKATTATFHMICWKTTVSSALTLNLTRGRKAASSCVWNISIERCGESPAFLWTAMRQWAVNGTSMPKIGNRSEMRAACRRRFSSHLTQSPKR